MKGAAFVIGLFIVAVGAVGMLAPNILIWIAQHFLTPGPLYFVAALRVTVGLLLLYVAPASRVPRMLRIVAFVPLLAGIALSFIGVERAPGMIQGWMQQGSTIIRLTTVVLLALGGFVA